ncbi:hypothetical protein DVT68_01570 [Dyella solisilvae]|uniref:Uncharacterized protein n=1 Tax=Dyella solisilvae TaxID=1920168 RepID=A0A370KAT6_9GAMM|nr:hypothetical protein [Dyella solisilvae]RDI99567.1 hypothetical protein DVT68_01570 [Dyella solisilvae]
MKANNLLALTAAALFTTVGLAAIHSNVNSLPPSEINGVKVITLAPVVVHPTAEDMRAAALYADAGVTATTVSPLLRPEAAASRGVLGAQLAMPYYSFGNQFGRISKE